VLFYPDLIKNTLETGWAKLQQADGMITESLSGGCMGTTGRLDGGGGRVMGDVSSLFVVEVLELFEFTNDPGFLARMMPVVEKAVHWMIDIGTNGTPLPNRQCCTYDIIDFAGYDHTTFNSFLYLTAMRACQRLSTYTKNSTLAAKCNLASLAAEPAINASLWNASSGYFRAWSGARFPTDVYTRGCHWIPRMVA
jgi:non-lysosomal glucosylceramidase